MIRDLIDKVNPHLFQRIQQEVEGRKRQRPRPPTSGGGGYSPTSTLNAVPFSPTQINLDWTSQGLNYTYDIYRDGDYVMSSSNPYYYDGGLERTSTHTYTVNVMQGGSLTTTLGPSTAQSLQPEPQNLALQSQDFSQLWVLQQATTGSSYVAPDGTTTANSLVETGNLGIHQAYQSATIAQGAIYTFTVYAKAGTRSWLSMNIQDSIPRRVLFNLSSGVVGAFPDSAGGSPTMTDAGNGWWRCSMSTVPNTTPVYIAITTATGDNLHTDDTSTITFTGNSSLAVYLWGAQLQQNYPATSYVATEAFPVALSGHDKSAPTAPVSTYSIPTSSSSTSITWDPCSDDTAMGFYEVFRNNFQVANIAISSGVVSAYAGGINPKVGVSNWYYDTGLPSSTLCTYKVRAVDTSGNRSAFGTSHSCSTVSLAAPNPTLAYTRPATLPDPNPSATTLRAKAATNFGLYFGSMVDPTGDHFGEAFYNNELKDEFNVMVPGNQLKYWLTEPSEGVYTLAGADTLLTFAQANNLKVRGHCLLWGSGNPAWLQNSGSYPYTTKTKNQLETTLVNHINAVVGHCATNYPGLVKWWDVTNEIIGWNGVIDTQTTGDPMLWTWINASADGLDYVRVAFATARAADPTATLVMNDYANLGNTDFTGNHSPDRTRELLNQIRYLKLQGVPIDAVGFQAHGEISTYEECMAVMKEYRDMGMSCHMTEIDYAIPRVVALPTIDTAGYQRVADVEGGVLLASALDSPNCTVFNLWGFDGTTIALYNQGGPTLLACYPWDTNGNKSPIYDKFYALLSRAELTPGAS